MLSWFRKVKQRIHCSLYVGTCPLCEEWKRRR